MYRPAASRGALIYFLLTDLVKIHTFYKYSLEAYLVVVHRAIDEISDKDKKFVKTGIMKDEKEGEKFIQNNEGED